MVGPTGPPPLYVYLLLTAASNAIVGVLTIMIVKDLVNGAGVLSVHWTTKLNVPIAVGVPWIVPVTASSARPVGSKPENTVHAIGGMLPWNCSVNEYGTPSVPLASDGALVIRETAMLLEFSLSPAPLIVRTL
jgi:hypothetical protein